MIGDDQRTMQVANSLFDLGVLARGIRPPTVPPGSARIRATVMATHTKTDLDTAIAAFANACI